MAIPAGADGFTFRHRAPPRVVCASCGSRFESGGATTGDRVRCPMCREVVQLAHVIAERRRHRRASHGAPQPVRAGRRTSRAGLFWLMVGTALAGVALFPDLVARFFENLGSVLEDMLFH
jgi:hypothetical protein